MGIFGHSMGGHGALICALKNPNLYKSVSSFAAICHPINCQWGEKNFRNYLGNDKETWKEYDSTELVEKYNGPPLELFIDQGSNDSFLKDQLLPSALVKAATKAQMSCILKMREGYDHSYYYIATFMPEHMEYHAKKLLI